MNHILKVEELTKIYRDRRGPEIRAVDKISFQVPQGEIFGLLGPNGAGKTTIVKMVCGLIIPDRGRILIEGIDNKKRRAALSKVSAVLEGNRNIYWRLTPRENMEYFAALKGRNPSHLEEEIRKLINFFDLETKENVPARKLSRGMQQKLAIAVCLISDAPLLLLDEPTLGLDVKASHEIRSRLREIVEEQGKTVILTTHDMNVVEEVCDRVLIMDEGSIITTDKIQKLLDLFKARSYRLIIEGELSVEQKSALDDLSFVELNKEDKRWILFLDLKNPENLYSVLDILKKERTIIEEIEQTKVNFEKIFMDLVERRHIYK